MRGFLWAVARLTVCVIRVTGSKTGSWSEHGVLRKQSKRGTSDRPHIGALLATFSGGIEGLGVRMDVWGAVSRLRGRHAATGGRPL